jgi:hypothetical protein
MIVADITTWNAFPPFMHNCLSNFILFYEYIKEERKKERKGG